MTTDAPPPALGELARRVTKTRSAWKALPDDSPDFAEYHEYQRALEAFRDACTPDAVVALASGGAAMREALEAIAKGEGRYSRDPLTHAENTIADMKALALAALTPERPADATPAPVRRGRLSEHPCDRCKQHEVYVRQDSNDDADYTIHCYGCGHHYRVDGPDA